METIKKLIDQFDELNIDGLMITGDWNRRYLSNFTGSNGVLLISKTGIKLITDYRYFEQASNQSNFDIVLHTEHTGHKHKIYDEVAKQVKEMKITRLGFEQQQINFGNYMKLKDLIKINMIPTNDLVENLRMVKSAEEIEKIRYSSKVTDQAYLYILGFIQPGMTELAVAEELESYIKEGGGITSTFSPIVASGVRASYPHGRASEKIIEQGDMITIDFGTNYQGYWSDISRVVAIGEPTGKLREIHQVLLTSFTNCVDNIRPGLTDQYVDKLMRDHLIETGFNKYSGTGTGHGIGLEVHEKPLFSVDSEKVLQPGMTITIEPGIYLPGVGGARIEDMLLVTEDGCEVLSPSTKELINL